MARKSILPRLSTASLSDEASSSSAESTINVAGARKTTRSGSVVSSLTHDSTPPTSLPEESVSDVLSVKQAMDAQTAVSHGADDVISRRSSRRRTGPATLGILAQPAAKRVASVETLRTKENRDFSGQTLVNETRVTSADTPHRKLLNDGLKALDMDWDINDLQEDVKPASEPRPKRNRRSSIGLDKIAEAVGKVTNKVLGKRGRDEPESSKDGARRSSRRLSALIFGHEKDTKGLTRKHEDDEHHVVERPSKMVKMTTSMSMPSLSTTFTHPTSKARDRPVKKFQKQGLYVGQNPEDYDPMTKKAKKRSSITRPSSMVLESTSKQPVMPLPMFGALAIEKPFVLPYSVFAPTWRERGTEKPKDWGRINKNRFVGTAREEWRTVKLPTSLCACKVECGEDCWNRAMGVECDKNNCNVGPECSNRDFSQLSDRMARAAKYDKRSLAYLFNAGVEVVKTNDRGFGVRACREFRPNEIITEYIGEIITQNEAYRRVKEEYAGKSDYYQMEFDQGMILDATRGSLARFVNHSCDPNCEMVKRNVAGQPRMALFAGDNGIMTGEELTYDYNFDPYSTTNIQKCLCGASNCRLVLGPKPAGEKKPSSKKEQLAMATDLKLTASGVNKRKASEVLDDALAGAPVELVKELKKKRKVPQMTKGWAYVDEEMERHRLEEAEKDKELRRLQREGVLADVNVSRPKYPSRSAAGKVFDKIKTTVTHSKIKAVKQEVDEPKPHKKSMISRMSGSFKRNEQDAAEGAVKRRSVLTTTGSLRQSTISFQPRNVSSGSGEALIEPPLSSSSAKAKSSKRNSLMSRTSSLKRRSTVRMVTEDDE